jgi:3-deoxy-7-phosphoheptulonate synthase
MPVCVDPSHSIGLRAQSPDSIPDIFHVAAQGIISGANLVLTDIHPEPAKALVDAAQALTLEELPRFLEDCMIAREAYEKRRRLAAAKNP